MIVRHLRDIEGTDRDIRAETWRSRRLILAEDRQRFSLHDTVLYAGTSTDMWYKHHVEAVYCISGEGTLLDRETGATHAISPGTMYLLDAHDRHTLAAHSDLRVICVFDPPCTGAETHDADGAYPLLTIDDATDDDR